MKKPFVIIVSGSRDCNDKNFIYEVIDKGIEVLGTPTTIISGGCRGVDTVAKEYANDRGINFLEYKADWNNIKAKDAIIKTRINPWTKKEEKYNANAGFSRNELMAEKGDALIAINIGGTPGTDNMIEKAKKHNLPIYKYEPEVLDAGDFMVDF